MSALILAVWFPATQLLHQRAAINASATELNRLHREDRALAREDKALSNPAEIARIARQDFQLVNPGERAFQVVPPTTAHNGAVSSSRDPANQPLVSPSSAAELPPGSDPGSSGGATPGAGSGAGGPFAGPSSGQPGSGKGSPHANAATGATGSQTFGPNSRGGSAAAAGSPGFFARIGQALEFWR